MPASPRSPRAFTFARRVGWAWLLCLALACSDGDAPTSEPTQRAGERPNVVLWVVDTLRADALPLYGHPEVDAPGLDGLARRSQVFTQARSASSWTRTSVTTLLTGLRPEVHGIETRADIAGASLELISEIFAAHGYRVGAIIANPNMGSAFGFDQGWDDFVELYQHRGGYVRSSDAKATAGEVVDAAIEWIDGRDERPFLLFALPIDPHSPYQPPAAYDRYGPRNVDGIDGSLASITQPNLKPGERLRVRGLYDGEVAYHDAAFSRLLWHLEGEGLIDDTVIVFTSDHGEEFWEHGKRSHGLELYEESVRVPLVIHTAGAATLAHEAHSHVEGVDVFPTILDLAGLPRSERSDGRSLVTGADPRRPAYVSLALDGLDQRAVVVGEWKLVIDDRLGETRLFDLEQDPEERVDVSTEHPEVVSRLRALADRMRDEALRGSEGYRADAGTISDDELSPELRDALEALGYIETEAEAGTESANGEE